MKKGKILLMVILSLIILFSGTTVNAKEKSGEGKEKAVEKKKAKKKVKLEIMKPMKIYVCPMEAHKGTTFFTAGKCVLCDMDLVAKEVIGAYVCPMHKKVGYIDEGLCPMCDMHLEWQEKVEKAYICPMREHQNKIYFEEGTCDECGMDLIPLEEVQKVIEDESKKKMKEGHDMKGHEMMVPDEDM